MSGSKSKSKTTQTSQTSGTTTQTPTTPGWIQQPWQDYGAQVSGLMASGQNIAPGASSLQQLAFSQAPGMLGMGQSGQASAAGKDPFAREVNGGAGDGYSAPAQGAQGNNYFDLARTLGMNAGTAGANTYQASGPVQTQSYEAAGASANRARWTSMSW